jgi:hypothetical protein
MPYRASASRCRVQVTSNVRLPKIRIPNTRQDTRFGNVVCRTALGKEVRIGRAGTAGVRSWSRIRAQSWPRNLAGGSGISPVFRSFAPMHLAERNALGQSGSGPVRRQEKKHSSASESWASPETKSGSSGLPSSQFVAGCGSIQNMVAALLRSARKPNHSVNLTRNSVPHLPGMARYAHNALPGKRGPLPRAGYLKR